MGIAQGGRRRAEQANTWNVDDTLAGHVFLEPDLQPSLDLANLFVDLADAFPLFAQGFDHDRGQSIRSAWQYFGDAFFDAGLALGHDFSVFGQ
jgi:hypothetical protein